MALSEETEETQGSKLLDESGTSGKGQTSGVYWWQRLAGVWRRWYRPERLFWGLLVLSYVYFLEPAGTNTISRYDMVWALAHGTAIIDHLAKNTIDVSQYHGHFYSPRSIGLSLLAVPAFWIVNWVMGNPPVTQWSMDVAVPLVNLFTVVPIAISATVVFYRFILKLRPALAGTPIPLVVTTAFALGTLEYPFAVSFFSHAAGGCLMFCGFYLLYRAPRSSHPERLVLFAGALVGLAVIIEYPTGVIMLVLVAYLLALFPGRRLRMLILFGLAMVPSALVLGWYDWFAFGNPFHISYDSVVGQQFHGQHTGFFGIGLPQPIGLEEILAWPRGLLVESPFLIFVVFGFIRWWRSSARPAPEMLVCLAVSVIYPLLVSSYYLPMAGQNLPGPRLLVPMLPFACLALAWALDAVNVLVRGVFAVLLALGVLLSYLYVVLGVYEYHLWLTYPITNLYIPVLQNGSVPIVVGKIPTPYNLATLYFQMAQAASLYIVLVPLAAWTIYLGVRLVRWKGRGGSPGSARQ